MGYVEKLRAEVGHRPLILPGSCVLLLDAQGRLLLQQRNEPAKRWGLLGGLMEAGERPGQVVVREVREESGLELAEDQLQLFGVYGGDRLATASNGDQFYPVITAFVARLEAGRPVISDDETLQFRWFALDAVPEPLAGTHQQIVTDFRKKMVSTDD
ncbi:NUDIX hydrolase [Lacticaseibacillus yichunensis]|uniref:NUDIX hydrolase n=1 Tax=Lacticaseibacillus yichunensis TaxID=2486015 RepID=A0ABW4CP23_9LACO|nr:NUDIX domain-containing protein [Lacticaseibacillus yichunensis]